MTRGKYIVLKYLNVHHMENIDSKLLQKTVALENRKGVEVCYMEEELCLLYGRTF